MLDEHLKFLRDVKRRWQILKVPTQSYEHTRMHSLMHACTILHKDILEDEGKMIGHYNEDENLPIIEGVCISTPELMASTRELYDRIGHQNRHVDLVEHICNTHLTLIDENL